MKKLTVTLTRHGPSIKVLISQNLHPQALKASLSPHSPFLTDQIYSHFIKSGHSLDPFLSTTLISHFAKHGDLSRALSFFLDTPNPDTISFNSLISGFARYGRAGPVLGLFNELRHLGLKPDVFTLSSLVKGCERIEENEIVHGACLRLGFGNGAFVVSGFIENYAKSGDLVSAEKCFRECLDVDNVVLTAMICCYFWNGEFDKGRQVFMKLRDLGFELNEFSLTGLISGLFDVKEGQLIHGVGLKMGFLCGGSLHFNNAVMSMYARCGSKLDAVKLFDEITEPDIVSWTERIGAALDGFEAFGIFNSLRRKGLGVNEYTMTNVLSGVAREGLSCLGRQIQAVCQKEGYLKVVFVGNALISMYNKCGKMDDARCIFDDMVFRDSVSWNSLIAGYSDNGFVSLALKMFSDMRGHNVELNCYTLTSILEVASDSNSLHLTVQIHSYMIKCGFRSDDYVVSCLIATYGKCGSCNESRRVFSDVDKTSVMHLNAMLNTLVNADCHVDSLDLFRNTVDSKLEVDSKTFSILLKACSAMTDLEQGRGIHSLALKSGFHQDCFVETAVIDLCCKCGNISDAERAFRYASVDNLAAWNAMITGYAQHGCYNEAFRLYDRMTVCRIEPDEITYLGLLTSCCHAGLLQEAQSYMNSMVECHRLIPHLEHYACMVDLLGRVGLLEDAKKTIDEMPIEPDARIWQILLSACNIHGNFDMGRVAATKLLELQPDNESAYILLSNLCASAGMWNAVRKLRREMKEKLVSKEPGSSWIQLRGSMHYFFADDLLHPEHKAIFLELSKLYEHMQDSKINDFGKLNRNWQFNLDSKKLLQYRQDNEEQGLLQYINKHGNSHENQGQGTLLVPQGQDDKPSWSMDRTLLTVPPLTHGKQNAA
ncbi:pentatricopeptide repeat-containing protein [Gossypium australe]|uniref:Pentatricopeptide repeat-containing protein n=1 Tax=Gossypium australe TaxID=47621 RepID=A0A5B6URQ3_9ROSI|nr:pentatricopeptide repeat-containing protein [Gossypium australe]